MAKHIAKIGEIIIGDSNDVLSALALGSCVGVVLFDKKERISTLAHVALPYAKTYPTWKKKYNMNDDLGRYSDTAIPESIRLLVQKGSQISSIRAKIAGGSKMFGTLGLVGSGLNIGQRNIFATKEILKLNKVKLVSSEVGGDVSRTIWFNVNSSILTIKKSSTGTILHI